MTHTFDISISFLSFSKPTFPGIRNSGRVKIFIKKFQVNTGGSQRDLTIKK